MSLRLWREAFELVLDNLGDGVFVVDRRQRLRCWNAGAERLAGHVTLEIGRGLPCRDLQLCNCEDGSACGGSCPVTLTIEDGRPREVAVSIYGASGNRIPAHIRTTALRSKSGAVMGVVECVSETTTPSWVLSRISELEAMAYVDPLTAVANRRFAEVQIRRSLAELVRFQWRFGVVLLDVDGLKQVNDRHGHRAGDAALRAVAATLSRVCRPFDVVGRWGGDEFVAVIKNVGEEQLEFVTRKLSAAVERASVAEGDDVVPITASAGAAMAEPGDTVATLVARADRSMYRRKANAHAAQSGASVPLRASRAGSQD